MGEWTERAKPFKERELKNEGVLSTRQPALPGDIVQVTGVMGERFLGRILDLITSQGIKGIVTFYWVTDESLGRWVHERLITDRFPACSTCKAMSWWNTENGHILCSRCRPPDPDWHKVWKTLDIAGLTYGITDEDPRFGQVIEALEKCDEAYLTDNWSAFQKWEHRLMSAVLSRPRSQGDALHPNVNATQ